MGRRNPDKKIIMCFDNLFGAYYDCSGMKRGIAIRSGVREREAAGF
jgi:hypothetical protein